LDRDSIVDIIRAKIREVVPDLDGHAIDPAHAMADLGLNSVERGEVIMLTLEALNLDLPLVALRGPRNIGELADLLRGKQPA
jgi:polyketide biosynthesis acyl carrier protein